LTRRAPTPCCPKGTDHADQHISRRRAARQTSNIINRDKYRATFADKCVLAVLGYTALTNYQALVADSYVARQELRQNRGDRTEGLILRWQEILPNAEISAQFYRVDEDRGNRRRSRRRVDAQQMQFFEEQFFATVNFWRVAGADIAMRRVNAGELSAYLAGDAARWLVLLRQQRGRWDEAREMQIAQAIRSLEILVNENAEIVRASDWQALEIGEPEFATRGDNTDISVPIFNPNDVDSPVSPLMIFVLLLGGGAILRWPNVTRIEAQQTITVTITISRVSSGGPIEVRFAQAHEL
jgi:hypothetical protein